LLSLGAGEQVALTIGGGVGPPIEMIQARTPDPFAERRLAAREDISDLVEQQPEEVAQLLRGWLADRGH